MPRRTAARLAFVVGACIVPAALVAMLLIGYDYYHRERDRLARDSMATARALLAAVDAELAGVKSALLALATSPHLSSGDLASVPRPGAGGAEGPGFRTASCSIEESGRQLDEYFPALRRAAAGRGQSGRAVSASSTPGSRSSPTFSRVRWCRSYFVAVGVPVRRDGEDPLFAQRRGRPEQALVASLRAAAAAGLDRRGSGQPGHHRRAKRGRTPGRPERLARAGARMKEVREDVFESRTVEGHSGAHRLQPFAGFQLDRRDRHPPKASSPRTCGTRWRACSSRRSSR